MTSSNSSDDYTRLRQGLKSKLQTAHQTRRPLLTHLNADSTWLLSLPYPRDASPPSQRCRFNILIDPWLKGSQSDVASWFSSQTHIIESSVQTISELNQILSEIEADLSAAKGGNSSNCIDLVAISHEFTDHCHEATLKEIDPSVPVVATANAAELMTSWQHFQTVTQMASFSKGIDWRITSTDSIPSWLGVARLITEGNPLYYHSAIVFCVEKSGSNGAAEAVVYTPHGVEADTFAAIATAEPPVQTLAFMHGLHDVSITLMKQLNLGAHNGLKAQGILKAKYWVGTHDEVKKGAGLIGPLLRRKQHTVEDALAQAMKTAPESTAKQTMAEVCWLELGNGESLVLA